MGPEIRGVEGEFLPSKPTEFVRLVKFGRLGQFGKIRWIKLVRDGFKKKS